MIALRSIARIVLAAALAVGGAAPLLAQSGNNPIIFLPENGVGTIQFPGAAALPLPGVLAPDPGPGGRTSALTYNLLGPPSLVPGDLLLFDGDLLSDVIRFNPAGTAPGYPASVVFYSALETVGGELADVGFPSAFYQNIVRMAEGMLGVVYTPTANQPGYVAGFAVTYRIESLTAAPEPGSVVLLATGLLGLVAVAGIRRHRGAA
ncbi:MAG: PEP-CTERM sorting domain-containing protein [Gemmatimonadaceae bacterium]|nr:PEP-CTERM sorting domain-containing protein [Gemmatimonadaceae bacterium]NUP70673.1 PEP-CTERM sorting domain-containing protein [Gemmatimonadaceae bacterium]NUS33565.1 PEP-CTERM sorting domain-containing protein [Gemmatimonadaceae bacterium]